MNRFRIKSAEIEAIQWTGENDAQIRQFMSWRNISGDRETSLRIHTPEGTKIASRGDWIVKDVNGHFYPCKPDIFEETYVRVDQ